MQTTRAFARPVPDYLCLRIQTKSKPTAAPDCVHRSRVSVHGVEVAAGGQAPSARKQLINWWKANNKAAEASGKKGGEASGTLDANATLALLGLIFGFMTYFHTDVKSDIESLEIRMETSRMEQKKSSEALKAKMEVSRMEQKKSSEALEAKMEASRMEQKAMFDKLQATTEWFGYETAKVEGAYSAVRELLAPNAKQQ